MNRLMKRYFVLFCAVLTMVLLPTSCLKGNDNEVKESNDMGVTYFYLGTLNREQQTESGTTITKIDVSDYNFRIDQQKRCIYNPDSLPVGTDITKVVCGIGAYNNGALFWESLTEQGVLISHSSSDSIDFSTPRKLRVYAYGTSKYSTYTITLNVHKQEGDVFQWTNFGTNDVFKSMKALRVLSLNGQLIVAGQKDGETVFYTSEEGTLWEQQIPDVKMAFAPDAYANTVCFDGYVYVLTNGNLLRSTDLQHWEGVYNDNGYYNFTRLVAAGTTELYCIGPDNQMMVSDDGGYTWFADLMDSSLDLMPTESIATVCYPYSNVKQLDYILLAGSRNADKYPQDKGAMLWHKIVDYSMASIPTSWAYMEWADNNTNMVLPCLEDFSLIHYTNKVLAIGFSDALGLSIYESKDSGLTWTTSTTYTLPSEIDTRAAVSACVDIDNFIWVVQPSTGQVWRGRLNKLGWK